MSEQPELNLGASAEELASCPGLLIDLALSCVPRRIGIAAAILNLLGGNSAAKVTTLYATVNRQLKVLQDGHRPGGGQLPAVELCKTARDLMDAVAALERSIFTLVQARLTRGLRAVPGVPEGVPA